MDQIDAKITLLYSAVVVIAGSIGCAFPILAKAQEKEESFEGFKVGIQAGWEVREIDEVILPASNNFRLTDEISDFAYGGFVGYDAQFDNLIIGVEAEFQPDGRALTADVAGVGSIEVESSWSANFSTRAGITVTPNLLAYGRLGYRLNRYKAKIDASGGSIPVIKARSNGNGIVYGGGLEYAVNKSVSIRAEYRETDFSILLNSSQFLVGASLRF